jgi:oxygen-independent coproporphyrinogen-3 oxidase
MTSHLYVHIPFCRSRCAYCDFASEPLEGHVSDGSAQDYVAALRTELSERGDAHTRAPAARDFETIYVGGGTPTVLPADLLLPLIDDLAARLAQGGELTIEANPGTIDAELLTSLAAAGVTRLSLGVQSFAPAGRDALGRRVTQAEVDGALRAIEAAGWREWSLDLVFGIPGPSWRDTAADLDRAVAARPDHISMYDLTYSAAYQRWVDGQLGVGAREAAGAMAERHYAEAVGRLEAAGYRRYEVSNFARPGHECRHNLAYWQGEDYLGIGAASVSTVGAERRTNPASVADYLAGRPPHLEPLTEGTRLWEKAMLGLRTREGVSEETVLPVIDHGVLERLLAQGCVERAHGKLRLIPGFLDVSNSVIGTLLVSPEAAMYLHVGGR